MVTLKAEGFKKSDYLIRFFVKIIGLKVVIFIFTYPPVLEKNKKNNVMLPLLYSFL